MRPSIIPWPLEFSTEFFVKSKGKVGNVTVVSTILSHGPVKGSESAVLETVLRVGCLNRTRTRHTSEAREGGAGSPQHSWRPYLPSQPRGWGGGGLIDSLNAPHQAWNPASALLRTACKGKV